MYPFAVLSYLRPRFACIYSHYGHSALPRRAAARRGKAPLVQSLQYQYLAVNFKAIPLVPVGSQEAIPVGHQGHYHGDSHGILTAILAGRIFFSIPRVPVASRRFPREFHGIP